MCKGGWREELGVSGGEGARHYCFLGYVVVWTDGRFRV